MLPASPVDGKASKITGTHTALERSRNMEYRGTEFTIVQAIEPHRWRWTVTVPDFGYRTGLAKNKEVAAAEARRAVAWLLAAKKRQPENA